VSTTERLAGLRVPSVLVPWVGTMGIRLIWVH